jgi:hypothetical protein
LHGKAGLQEADESGVCPAKSVGGFGMCGRFARIVSDRKLREKYRLKEAPQLEAR